MAVQQRIDEVLPAVVEIRHDLHRHPELGYQEHRTSGRVCELLAEWGVEHRGGLARGTGVLAYLPATTDPATAATVALRADMDALPIAEETGAGYASETPGVMHACGHDGHTSILLGTARVLSQTERPNNVVFVFQPAEEGGAGGLAMCQDGALDGRVLGRKVDRIFGLHGYPAGELGHVYTRVGPLMAAASEFKIRIHGKGTHAAYPHFGIDPMVAAAYIISALQTIASRNVDPLGAIVVTVGKVEGGVAHNVIPDMVTLSGTLRTLDDEMTAFGMESIGRVAEGVASGLGARAEVEWVGAYPVTRNDANATAHFRAVAERVLGADRVHEEPKPSMGGEDFSFYGQHVPACFYFLGIRPAGQASYPNLHSPKFDFNDDALRPAIEAMVGLATATDYL
jgi:amidohydrolase